MDEFAPLREAFSGTAEVSPLPLRTARDETRALMPYLDRYALTPLWQGRDVDQVYAGFIASGAFSLWCQVWAPPAPVGTVFVVHGYFDHLGLYRHLLAMLLARGWQVVLWDLPGHGLSSGERAAIDDFATYGDCLHDIQAVLSERRLTPAPWVGIGQSTGASILATDVLCRPAATPWVGLALLAPLVRPCRWRQTGPLQRLAAPFVKTFPRPGRHNSTDRAFVDFLHHRDPLQPRRLNLGWVSAMRRWMPQLLAAAPSTLPVLLMQGEQDRTVDWRYNLAVLTDKFPRAHVYRQPDARHHLVNEAPPIREALLAELGRFLDGLAVQTASRA